MSRETLEWLNDNTLIGFADELGKAWHHDGSGTNHFDGAVPTEEVRQLFRWEAQAVDVTVQTTDLFGHDMQVDGYKAIVHPDTGHVFQIASGKYAIHQYGEWLIDEVETLVDVSDGELEIGTAGLLRGGAQAWVQVRPPSTVQVGGDEQLPWILATTSHDGSLATQYKAQRQRVVCDNTLAVGLAQSGGEYRVRHTSNSRAKLGEARAVLEIMYAVQTEFDREIERLMNTAVSTALFREATILLHPEVEPKVEDGKVVNQRAINNRDRIITDIDDLWFNDERVGEYHGTMWGAWQAHNTWFHWGRTRGTGGDEALMKARQTISNISGDTAAYDRKVMRVLEQVVGS